ncbi:Glucanosyltransferase-domain-containing protein [Pseudoneurospora amorphoporcata]|uniref:1,3-beta-glucanosyltransferase n=1 Tax=Pseudoneurospora amorphoporcata TaxID=241081 RepID=A0AAN6P4J2_9PEZI|nr:Glucanosyltransferase-domain-containing protein [Pseudoneurospora amorphoporcata]
MLIQSTLIALSATLAAAVKPLSVKNQFFVDPSDNIFQIVGVAYQPGGSAAYDAAHGKDPLSNGDICRRDAAILQILGVNTIRVYNLNPDVNHDECASIFNAAGIYMILDVNSPQVAGSLQSYNPWESYYDTYVNRTFAVVEAFKNYDNTLAFFSGNEVINDESSAGQVPPYMRAVTRDIKNYVAKHCDRKIPVGYSAADVREVLFDSFEYFTCAEDGKSDDPSRADIFALNSYSWCGESDFQKSGYVDLVEGFSNTSVPVFYSEYGCNAVQPRPFTEVGAIYGKEFSTVFSGGIVYEYTQEDNDYGLVQVNTKDQSVTLLKDFYTLKDQFAKLDWKKVQGVKSAKEGSGPKAPKCDKKLIQSKDFYGNFTLPDMPPNVDKILAKGVSPKPTGKLIDIKDFSVKYTVKNADGSVISGLAVKALGSDESNAPGTNDAKLQDSGSVSSGNSTSSGSDSDAQSDDTKNSGAADSAIAMTLPAVAMGAFAIFAGLAL